MIVKPEPSVRLIGAHVNMDSVVEAGAFVRVHDDGPVRVVTLARPERHNALVPELIDGIRAGEP